MSQTNVFRPTIGLEVHAELNTNTKMFCSCKNDPDEIRPNVNICPICLAHPGTLPVINREAVRNIFRVGGAVGGTLVDFSEFDRKSYFYPDIPKGYQVSQYEHPFIKGGELAGVTITRVHLEEDTARSTHGKNKSLIDFNRAGVPLMELVTEPVIHDAETAGKFARELQLLLRTLGAGKANLEKGEMRIEANISVSADEKKFGTKVEVKNLNSFRSVERAIAYEISRQTELIESGGAVVQETRGWDETKQETFSQRLKEGSADYRYFPEPDLPKFSRSDIPEFSDENIRASLPELPGARRSRYVELGIKADDAAFIASGYERGDFFDSVIAFLEGIPKLITLAANYLVSDIEGLNAKREEPKYPEPASYAKLTKMIAEGEVSSAGAKAILAHMLAEGGNPEEIAKKEGLLQVHDEGALEVAVERIIVENPGPVEDYKTGKEAALKYLVGQAMKAMKGAGNPAILRDLLIKKLKG